MTIAEARKALEIRLEDVGDSSCLAIDNLIRACAEAGGNVALSLVRHGNEWTMQNADGTPETTLDVTAEVRRGIYVFVRDGILGAAGLA